MTTLNAVTEAAYEALWVCRITESRLLSPTHAPWKERYGTPLGITPLHYDYYVHTFAADRLLKCAEVINRARRNPGLTRAIGEFRDSRKNLQPVSDVLLHPHGEDFYWQRVHGLSDRIEYRHPASGEVVWSFTIEELHRPVEELWRGIDDATS